MTGGVGGYRDLGRRHGPVDAAGVRCDLAAEPPMAAPSLCKSASTTGAPSLSWRSEWTCLRPNAGGSAASSRYHWRSDARLPRFSSESPSTNARLCQQYPTGVLFRGCIVRFILRPACLSSPPDWLRQDEVICSSPCLLRYIVTPAFDAVRYRTTLGVRLNGRTGNLPLLGLSPNQYQQLVRLHAKA